MPRTILEIGREAAERAKQAAPTTLYGSNDRIARFLRVAAIDTMREIMDRTDRDGLSEFQATWVFELEPDKFVYDLPADFMRVIPYTEHRNGWPLGLLGPVSPVAWANWLGNVNVPSTPYGWRIQHRKIYFEPVPTAYELIQFGYLSRFAVMVALSDLTAGQKQGDNFPRLPLVPMEGSIKYAAVDGWGTGTWGNATWGNYDPANGGTFQDFMTGLRREIADGSLGWSTISGPFARKERFDADTDLPALDDDHVLSLGMTWRLEKDLRRPYAENMARYFERLEVLAASDAGGARDIRFDDNYFQGQAPLDNNGSWVVS